MSDRVRTASRRHFLKSTVTAIASMQSGTLLRASIARPLLVLTEISRGLKTTTVEATLFDVNGVLCLDAKNAVRFLLAGFGRLIDNRGTSTGSRLVEMYNGRAQISIACNGGASTVSAVGEGISPVFVSIA